MSETPVKVLLVEDNPGDAGLIQDMIAHARSALFQVTHVKLLAEGVRHLADNNADLVLLDLTLPDCCGSETFARTHQAAPHVPIIVFTGMHDEEVALKIVQDGAQDYLIKGQVNSELLVRAMRYAIERKRVEEMLAHERDLFRTLLDNVPVRIYFKDEKSRFTLVNRAVAQQFGLGDPDQAIGKSDFDFFAAEHAKSAFDDEQQIMRTGLPMAGKVEREIYREGYSTWSLTTKVPLRDKQGRIIGTFGISKDITEIKRMEGVVADERNLLRSLIDSLPDHIYVKDAAGHFIVANTAAAAFLGAAEPEDMAGKTDTKFFTRDAAAQFAGEEKAVIQSGLPCVNREARVIGRDGKQLWMLTTKVPLRDRKGQIVGTVGINRDISDIKRVEDELKKLNADLQRSHEELNAAQMQLVEAEKMHLVGRLAAGVAHEVKNPLAISMMGLAYLKKHVDTANENIAMVLKDMDEALHRADSVIRGLLDFSAPSSIDAKPADFNALIDRSLLLVKHELDANCVLVTRELGGGVPAVRMDANKIEGVFINILTNAIHAMPNGGRLTVRTYARQITGIGHNVGDSKIDRFRVGETVVLAEVDDTGSGVPEEKISKVFDPFFTTKPAGKGTGLGLTLCKTIIRLHGGTITLANRQEGGARVTITLRTD